MGEVRQADAGPRSRVRRLPAADGGERAVRPYSASRSGRDQWRQASVGRRAVRPAGLRRDRGAGGARGGDTAADTVERAIRDMERPVTLAYRESGSGSPVVLLHAFPLSSAMWETQYGPLGAVSRLITPDLPGFGRSPSARGQPSVDLMADEVKDLLDHIGLDTVVL